MCGSWLGWFSVVEFNHWSTNCKAIHSNLISIPTAMTTSIIIEEINGSDEALNKETKLCSNKNLTRYRKEGSHMALWVFTVRKDETVLSEHTAIKKTTNFEDLYNSQISRIWNTHLLLMLFSCAYEFCVRNRKQELQPLLSSTLSEYHPSYKRNRS